MPQVYISRDSKKIRDSLLAAITNDLPAIVAWALDTPEEPDGSLTYKDITIEARDFGPFDVYTKPLKIIILANDYPKRRETLDERRKKIITMITDKFNLRGNRFSVWIGLMHGSYGEG